ncbi:hypothetical protein [Moraxella sp.]|uniref:hypothetical protein n=1 Tax=Moraxella sp. TaxID=479 RepID=UPI0026DA9C4E|nr:hypothetical protein [Moraxella sp.]MDO4895260.1 hypothetical protein [Moraxella sp.]
MTDVVQNGEKLSFTKLAVLAMQMVNRPITPSELWQFVLDNHLHYRLGSFDVQTQTFRGKTPKATFQAMICTDKENFQEVPSTKPKQYVLKNFANKIDVVENDVALQNSANKIETAVKSLSKKPNFHERDLHALLTYFLKHNDYFRAYSKTIFHEESQKGTKGEDKWLYPDMVAVNFEYANYGTNNVLKFIEKFDIKPIRIFSFEIKKELSFSNYKESFFQAVSNSSWANEGYLVALDIKQDGQFIEALQKLSQSFGIGIIELNLQNVSQSKILSPAKFKEKLDYSVVYELADKNPNFREFLKTVSDFDLANSKRFLNEFDKILSDDELMKQIQALMK